MSEMSFIQVLVHMHAAERFPRASSQSYNPSLNLLPYFIFHITLMLLFIPIHAVYCLSVSLEHKVFQGRDFVSHKQWDISKYEINNLKCMHEYYVRRQDNLEAAEEPDGPIFLFLPPWAR